MLKESPKLLHWNYFLVLEADLEHLSRYIEFTKDNYQTYSQEMVHLLLAAGSEVDVVLKSLCRKTDSNFKGEKIDKYREFLNPKYPKLCRLNIRLPRYGLDISPWDNWQNNKTPLWWGDYNKVKHSRDELLPEEKREDLALEELGQGAVLKLSEIRQRPLRVLASICDQAVEVRVKI